MIGTWTLHDIESITLLPVVPCTTRAGFARQVILTAHGHDLFLILYGETEAALEMATHARLTDPTAPVSPFPQGRLRKLSSVLRGR